MDSQEFDLYRRTTEVYMRKGIKKITMDDMSRELKVSKKTLYKYVKNRAELVDKSMEWKLNLDIKVLTGITEKKLNAIEELWEMSSYHVGHLKMIHPSLHQDLAKYYKEAWKKFNDFTKVGFLYSNVVDNIKKGISEGYYRSDFNVEVIAKLYLNKIDMVFDPTVFPPTTYNFGDVCREMVKYHLCGIATEKGLLEMKKFWEDNRPEPGVSSYQQNIIKEFLTA